MRLIDADELIEHIRKDPLFELVDRYGIVGVIASSPTVEVKKMNNVIDGYSPVESTTIRATGTGVEHNWDKIGYQTGWVCPICGRINAPWMPSCTCQGITTGEWIPVQDDEDGYTCSICNAYMKAYKGILSNYCPNCGVKMNKRKV